MSHTKLPWVANPPEEHDCQEEYFVMAGEYTVAICCVAPDDGDPEDNAALIVKAVNNHQKLVDALENALRRLEKADKHIDCSIEMSECEEVLAKAKS